MIFLQKEGIKYDQVGRKVGTHWDHKMSKGGQLLGSSLPPLKYGSAPPSPEHGISLIYIILPYLVYPIYTLNV